jgi:hypothetical protein
MPCPVLLRLRIWIGGLKLGHHDDPHPQYRFGLLPRLVTAPPSGGWKTNVPMAIRPEASHDRMSPTDLLRADDGCWPKI